MIKKFRNNSSSLNFQKSILKFYTFSDIESLSIAYTDSGTSLPSSSSIFDEIPNYKFGLFSFKSFDESLNLYDHLQV